MISKIARRLSGAALLLFLLAPASCSFEHRAPVRSAELPALSPPVLHSTRLWVELADEVPENTCVSPANYRLLCFEHVRRELSYALSRSLWSSFPGVELGDGEHHAGDYVLHVALNLEALAPDASGPGWSAGARGNWHLERDGKTLAGEQVASRSRGDFAYGSPLGVGAGEVIDAVAVRIGMALGALPESHRIAPVPLPAVATAPLPAPTPKPTAGSGSKTSAL